MTTLNHPEVILILWFMNVITLILIKNDEYDGSIEFSKIDVLHNIKSCIYILIIGFVSVFLVHLELWFIGAK
jgi:hypothetical protein